MKKNGKKRKQKPQNLLRQKRLSSLLLEDGGKTPIGKLMLQAGYAKAYAKNPQHLKKTSSWKELMEMYLPDDLLSRKHQELLNKKEYLAIGKKGEREVVPTGEIDPNAVSKGLDMAYKLKSKYPKGSEEDHQVVIHVKND
ncbi:MAG: hypothetical protein AAB706_02500 [Patescibacteria group bacterium]